MSYTSGVINIPHVTGNIVITATATQATVSSISAVFVQGQNVIYDTDSLDTLKQYLTVTATYADSSTGVVTNYTLSGTLTVGTSTVTVNYAGLTTTFNVTVSERWEYHIGDLTKVNGVLGNNDNVPCKMHLDTNPGNTRRAFVVNFGKTCVPITNNGTVISETSDYYPVKVPVGATKITLTITPSTQYVQALMRNLVDGVYSTMTTQGQTGYTAGSNYKTFDAVSGDSYAFVSTKYNSGGSTYSTEPTGLDIVFE